MASIVLAGPGSASMTSNGWTGAGCTYSADSGAAPGALRLDDHLIRQHRLSEKLQHRFKDLRDYSLVR
jgi:hypothetical protein